MIRIGPALHVVLGAAAAGTLWPVARQARRLPADAPRWLWRWIATALVVNGGFLLWHVAAVAPRLP